MDSNTSAADSVGVTVNGDTVTGVTVTGVMVTGVTVTGITATGVTINGVTATGVTATSVTVTGVTVTGVTATGVTVNIRIYIPCSNLSRVINVPKVFLKFHPSLQANAERIFRSGHDRFILNPNSSLN